MKVVDFGLATTDPEEANVAGTVDYMAPELFCGEKPSVRSDLYALGVIADDPLLGQRLRTDASLFALEQAQTRGMSEILPPLSPSAGATRASGEGGAGPATPTLDLATGLAAAVTVDVSTPKARRLLRADDPARAVGYRAAMGLPEGHPLGPVADALQQIVRTLFAPQPADRYASADEVLAAIAVAVAAICPSRPRRRARASSRPRSSSAARRRWRASRRPSWAPSTARAAPSWSAARAASASRASRRSCARSRWCAGPPRRTARACRRAAARTRCGSPSCARCPCGPTSPTRRRPCSRSSSPISRSWWTPHPRRPPPAPRGGAGAARRRDRLPGAAAAAARARQLEDLHWARDDSLTLFARLARAAPGLPLLLVGNYRDDEEPELARRVPEAQSIHLERLGRQQIARLSRSMLGRAGERPEIVEFLGRETEGNLFFLVEVVRALAEQAGQLDRVGEVPLPEHVLTGGIEELARRRVDRVPSGSRPPGPRGHGRAEARSGGAAGAPPRGRSRCLAGHLRQRRRAGERRRRLALRARQAPRGHPEEPPRGAAGRAARPGRPRPGGRLRGRRPRRPQRRPRHHFLEAGELAPAAHYARRAGDIATRLCSYGEARAHYDAATAALARLPPSDDVRRRHIDVLLKQIYTALVTDPAEQNFKRAAEARALLDAIAPEADLLPEDRFGLARVHYFYGRIHFYRAETHQAIDYYRKVLPTAQEAGDESSSASPPACSARRCSSRATLSGQSRCWRSRLIPSSGRGSPSSGSARSATTA